MVRLDQLYDELWVDVDRWSARGWRRFVHPTHTELLSSCSKLLNRVAAVREQLRQPSLAQSEFERRIDAWRNPSGSSISPPSANTAGPSPESNPTVEYPPGPPISSSPSKTAGPKPESSPTVEYRTINTRGAARRRARASEVLTDATAESNPPGPPIPPSPSKTAGPKPVEWATINTRGARRRARGREERADAIGVYTLAKQRAGRIHVGGMTLEDFASTKSYIDR